MKKMRNKEQVVPQNIGTPIRKNKPKLFTIHKARWLVEKASEIPEDFPFEDFSTVTVRGTVLSVAYRIDECLRKRSTVVEFNAQTAEAVCKTASLMMYHIRLYEGPTKNTIIVEVQRWRDCGFEFREEREAIFEAAKGYGFDDSDITSVSAAKKKKSVVECASEGGMIPNKRSPDNDDNNCGDSGGNPVGPASAKKKSRTSYLMSSDMDSLSDLYTPMTNFELKKMLEAASFQLGSRHPEVQLVALQNLTSMTNTEESYLETSLQMSKLILEDAYGLRESLTSLCRQDLDRRKTYDVSLREQICLSSFQVMFNALESVFAHFEIDSVKTIISEGYSCFSQSFLVALIEAIGQYEMSHIACLATKCLACLLKICPELREEALRQNALQILKGAESYGHECHLALESEATNTIDIMMYKEEGFER